MVGGIRMNQTKKILTNRSVDDGAITLMGI